jgi:tRNA threonylcarbamoyladenosine biosynthesis protein TsaB
MTKPNVRPPRLLALDTSTDHMSVAAGDGARSMHWEGEGGAAASAQLMPRIAQVLAALQWTMDDLDGIAFGQGPGSFTGVRTACAVAQGLGFGARGGLGVPVLPICTLQMLAQAAQADHPGRPVLALLDARMHEVYAGIWLPPVAPHAPWQQVLAPCALAPTAVAALVEPHARLHGPLVLCGNARLAYGPALPDENHPGVAAWVDTKPHARAALHLALPLHAQGAGLAPALAQPVYVRDKVALTTAERMAAKAQAGVGEASP